ncbi:MAG: flagellar biosynthesis protein FlhA [Phycisphaerae bacterium]|nr:flagellar biosynthesis protein FlhA [Phycisphaerae bacterium]
MAKTAFLEGPIATWLHTRRGMLVPMAAISLIFVILIPLPTPVLDVLLLLNITISAAVLLTVMYIHTPLEFSAFPSLLLALTLLRLVLNTATTRLILTNADRGTAAAGRVIEEFAGFVASGSLVVGLIIFVIITVIQFVVITKGATRIAEVAARFTLDGMPGKQMAIDADLNAGIIKEDEARRRREAITREADFYGAMDGASKFVRGDAIAALIITLVNIIGGVYIGMVEKGFGLMQSLEIFAKLSIGDGLVAQIPAFLVSVGAGMLVTRSAARTDAGEELISQITGRPISFLLTGGFILVLLVTPLPKLPLLMVGGGCVALAAMLNRGQRRTAVAEAAKARAAAAVPREPEKVESYLAVDPIELEVGYGLIRLVDHKHGGDLLDRITNIRRQIATELGLIVPPIRIRDNLQLEPNAYAVRLRGVEVARGELMPGHYLAIDSGAVTSPVAGVETREPAFGLPALWVTSETRATAETNRYTVVEASAVLATHLTELIKLHAPDLLTRQELNRLLESLKERSSKIVEELMPEVMKPGEVQKVLQALLRERVPIRDLETILETLCDWAPRTKDVEVLTEYVRNALARTICQTYRGDGRQIHAVTIDPTVEDLVAAHVERTDRGTHLTIPPVAAHRLVAAVRNEVEAAAARSEGRQPVVICSPQVRVWLRRLIESALPSVPVLAYNEIVRGFDVKTHGMVVMEHEPANVPSAVHV